MLQQTESMNFDSICRAAEQYSVDLIPGFKAVQ